MKLQLLPSLTSLQCLDLTSRILVNKAYTWEALCGLRDPLKITTIVVHHDAIMKSMHADKTNLQYANVVANGHIGNKEYHAQGDPGNPYHLMVRNAEVCQNNDLLAFTYGVSDHNGDTIHVCVAGNYEYGDTITQEDYNMLCTAIISLMAHPELPNLKTIKGHKEFAKTECPGKDINMNQLRSDVVNLQNMLVSNDTWAKKKARISEMSGQFKYINDRLALGEDDPNGQWAAAVYMDIYDFMKSKKYL